MARRFLALTCMKNEGPYLLEWVAYHLSVGVDHFLIYTNDCEDGTTAMLDRLAVLGLVTHRDNTRKPGQRPAHQVRAYRKAHRDPVYKDADWVVVIDADEFINVHVGARTLPALTEALPQAGCISLMWRVFGTDGQARFRNHLLTERLQQAAPEFCPRPMQAWGMKSIHRTDAVSVIGCHRPRAVSDGDWQALGWHGGNGTPMPEVFFGAGWRMNRDTAGYELGQVNHYALRSAEHYLLKIARGRGYTGDTLGLDYWRAMNRNEVHDDTIQPLLPAVKERLADLLSDPVLERLHRRATRWHKGEIAKLRDSEDGRAVFNAILQEDKRQEA